MKGATSPLSSSALRRSPVRRAVPQARVCHPLPPSYTCACLLPPFWKSVPGSPCTGLTPDVTVYACKEWTEARVGSGDPSGGAGGAISSRGGGSATCGDADEDQGAQAGAAMWSGAPSPGGGSLRGRPCGHLVHSLLLAMHSRGRQACWAPQMCRREGSGCAAPACEPNGFSVCRLRVLISSGQEVLPKSSAEL